MAAPLETGAPLLFSAVFAAEASRADVIECWKAPRSGHDRGDAFERPRSLRERRFDPFPGELPGNHPDLGKRKKGHGEGKHFPSDRQDRGLSVPVPAESQRAEPFGSLGSLRAG